YRSSTTATWPKAPRANSQDLRKLANNACLLTRIASHCPWSSRSIQLSIGNSTGGDVETSTRRTTLPCRIAPSEIAGAFRLIRHRACRGTGGAQAAGLGWVIYRWGRGGGSPRGVPGMVLEPEPPPERGVKPPRGRSSIFVRGGIWERGACSTGAASRRG